MYVVGHLKPPILKKIEKLNMLGEFLYWCQTTDHIFTHFNRSVKLTNDAYKLTEVLPLRMFAKVLNIFEIYVWLSHFLLVVAISHPAIPHNNEMILRNTKTRGEFHPNSPSSEETREGFCVRLSCSLISVTPSLS